MCDLRALMCCLLVSLACTVVQAEEANVARLVEQLKSTDATQQKEAAEALGELGPQAIDAAPALIQALADENSSVLVAAAEALGKLGPKAVAPLTTALKSKNRNVRVGAAHALSQIGPDAAPAVDVLIQLVQTGDDRTRPGAIEALAAIGPAAKPAVSALMEAAKIDDFQTQYRACIALEAIGPAAIDAAPLLQELLKARVTSVRVHAAAALGGLGPKIGDGGVKSLIAALEDRSYNVRQSAAIALGRLGKAAQSAVPVLEAALDEQRIDTRVDAVEAIWKITGDIDRTLPRLTAEAVGEDDPEHAVALLVKLGPAAKPAVAELARHLKSKNPLQRFLAANALGELGTIAADASDALKKCQQDPEPVIRMAAQQALERIKEAQKSPR